MKFLVDSCLVTIFMVLSFGVAAPCSHAQSGGEFMHNSAYGTYKGEDLKLLKEAISKAQESGAINEPLNWSNPKSGAKGSVTVTKRLTRDGRPCAWLAMVNEAQGKQRGTTKFLWCQQESGEWKIVK